MGHRFIAVLVVAALCLSAGAAIVAARDAKPSPLRTALPAAKVAVRAGRSLTRPAPILAPGASGSAAFGLSSFTAALGPATADIQVTYNGFSAAAQAAFEAAVQVWETKIVSSRVIHVQANWSPLGSGVLGSAGPSAIYLMDDDHWYPVALAEALCACESPESYEVSASFNSTFSGWYLGTDGNPPAGKYDFMTVVMHELGHGLGFLSSFRSTTTTHAQWGYSYFGATLPMRFDTHEWDSLTGGSKMTNTSVYPNASTALMTALMDGGVYFGGANVVATLGARAKLYAPATWSGGSSNSHFDEAAFPTGTQNALMTPFLSNGEVIHDPGPLTLALFSDIGWQTAPSTPLDVTPPAVSAPRADFATPQTVGATVLVHVSWSDAVDNSGIAAYQVQFKRNSAAWKTIALASPTQTSVDIALAHGKNYRFRVAATDGSGNTSAFATSPLRKLIRPQETAPALAYGGAWKRVKLSGASGGRVRWSATADSTATFTFTGNSVGLVTTRGANRGIAEIRLDGNLVAIVDLYSPTLMPRTLAWSSNALDAGAHTVQVRVTGTKNAAATGTRIDVDALYAWK